MFQTLALAVGVCLATSHAMPLTHLGRPVSGFVPPPVASQEQRDAAGAAAELYARQRVDNFDPNNDAVFSQLYYANASFWKPGGPVFLQIGGESAIDPIWVTTGAWQLNAERFGALMILAEHRFYGKSQPFDDLSTEHLKFLSSEQALADLVSLKAQASEYFNIPADTKWITFGGSYSGALSSWARLKYPDSFHAAVANSGPVLAELDFVQYNEVVAASLATSSHGTACTDRIQDASNSIMNLLSSATGRQTLAQKFTTCESSIPNSALDIANFMETIAGSFQGVVQYNRDNRAFEGATNTNITVQTICDTMTDSSITDAIDAYAKISNFFNAPNGKCFSTSFSDMTQFLSNTSLSAPAAGGSRQWTYQTCAEFAYFQTTDSTKVKLFGNGIPLQYYIETCIDAFGPEFTQSAVAASVANTNTHYNAKSPDSTNVIWINGDIDPWHALSVTTPMSGEIVFVAEGTAHCAAMYPPSPSDLPSLTKARALVTQQLKEWLA